MPRQDRISNIYIKLRGVIARSVLGIVPPKEIEDIVQETYVRACQIKNRDAIREPQAFLLRVARNLALDYVRRSETRLATSEADADDALHRGLSALTDETLEQVVSREEFGEFCEAVRRLPVQQRRAFVLKKVYGYTQREIAQEMQLSEKTVERHIALGAEKCIEYLKSQDDMTSGVGIPAADKAFRGDKGSRNGGQT